jgi:hypothetical protein
MIALALNEVIEVFSITLLPCLAARLGHPAQSSVGKRAMVIQLALS